MLKSLAEHIAELRRALPVRLGAFGAKSTAPETHKVDLSTFRPLNERETSVITAMLSQTGLKAREFLPQLEGLLVQRNCTCGCPSLSFAPPSDEMRVDLCRQRIVADMTGEAADGLVGLLLWQAEGKLTGLEVYDLAGREDGTPYQLPTPDTLVFFRSGEPDADES